MLWKYSCQRASPGVIVAPCKINHLPEKRFGTAPCRMMATWSPSGTRIGRFREDPQPTPEKHQQRIDFIEALPGELRALVQDLSDRRLDTPYRPGGWTIRQVVHHLADSHMNGYIRTKLAVTEDVPTVKPFDEEAWATLPDSRVAPSEVSLRLLEALHARWVATLRSLGEPAFLRKMYHPEFGTQTVSRIIQGFAWHGRHHRAHIANLRAEMGW